MVLFFEKSTHWFDKLCRLRTCYFQGNKTKTTFSIFTLEECMPMARQSIDEIKKNWQIKIITVL